MKKSKYKNIMFGKEKPILEYDGLQTLFNMLAVILHETMHLIISYLLKHEITEINILKVKQTKKCTITYGNIKHNADILKYNHILKPIIITLAPKFLLIPVVLCFFLSLKQFIILLPTNILLLRASCLSISDWMTIKELLMLTNE